RERRGDDGSGGAYVARADRAPRADRRAGRDREERRGRAARGARRDRSGRGRRRRGRALRRRRLMPSLLHEALRVLFQNRPALAPELLGEALGVDVPAYREVRIESADLAEVAPAEYRADLVVLLLDEAPVLAIVLEVQLAEDARKRYTWPVYVATVRARF